MLLCGGGGWRVGHNIYYSITLVFQSELQAACLWDLLQSGRSGYRCLRPDLQRKGGRSSKAGGGAAIRHHMHFSH